MRREPKLKLIPLRMALHYLMPKAHLFLRRIPHKVNDVPFRQFKKVHFIFQFQTKLVSNSLDRSSNASTRLFMFRTCSIFLLILLLVPPALAGGGSDPVELIVSAIRAQHYDEAISAADSALKENPRNFRVWTLKGIALSRKGEVPAALKAFQRALVLSPNYPAALKAEAKLLFEAGDKRAIPVLQQIVRREPGDQTAHEMLAVVQAKQGVCDAALSQFQLIDETVESHPNALQWYGYCLMRGNRLTEAAAEFEHLVKLFPEQPYPRYDLALIQTMAGKNAEAIQTLQPLLSAQAPDPDVLSLASEAYEAIGDTPNAVSLLRQAIVLDPSNADLYIRFAGLCLSHDSFEVGIDVINAGLKHIPKDASLYIGRGLLYGQLAQYEKAEQDFETAEQLNPSDSTSAYALAATEVQNGDLEHAQKAVEQKLADHPNVAALHFMLAKILIDRGAKAGSSEFRRAMDSALLAVRLKPDLMPARNLLASMYLALGQNDLAAKQCRIVLEKNPSDQSALYHLIGALRNSDQKAEVQVLIKQLLDLQHNGSVQEGGSKRYKLIEQNQTVPK